LAGNKNEVKEEDFNELHPKNPNEHPGKCLQTTISHAKIFSALTKIKLLKISSTFTKN